MPSSCDLAATNAVAVIQACSEESGRSSLELDQLLGSVLAEDLGIRRATPRDVGTANQSLVSPVPMQIAWEDQRREAQQQEKLKESEERFMKAFRSCPLAMSISTRDEGRFLNVNEAFLRALNYPEDEVIGHTAAELDIWAEPQERGTLMGALAASGSLRAVPTTFKTSNGEVRQGSFSAELIDVRGQSCVLATMQDVTEEKRLQEQFRQAQKMEALGRLAGGVAHDFNNMLSVIMGYSDLSLQETALPPSAARNLNLIKGAAERAAKAARQLLAFSRPQALYPHTLDLNRVISDMSTMIQRIVGEDVALSVRLSPSECLLEADLGQLEQTILNLIVNSRDAMADGGELLIETKTLDVDDVQVDAHAALPPGKYVSLCIGDTGCGMDASTMSHIFEPFFTTKDSPAGTGLGLSTVYGIVKQSNGHIWVHSETGKGTCFKIYFPFVHAPALAKIPPRSDLGSLAGSETVLVVEDEDGLRELICIHLRSAGYALLQARNAEEAIQLFKCGTPKVDVLLTDGVMPGISGIELTTCLRSNQPALRVLLMSGYTTDMVAGNKALPDIPFIEKPFTRSKLLAALRSVLTAQSAESRDECSIELQRA